MCFQRGYSSFIISYLSDSLRLLKPDLHEQNPVLSSTQHSVSIHLDLFVLRCVCVMPRIALRWKINIFHASNADFFFLLAAIFECRFIDLVSSLSTQFLDVIKKRLLFYLSTGSVGVIRIGLKSYR